MRTRVELDQARASCWEPSGAGGTRHPGGQDRVGSVRHRKEPGGRETTGTRGELKTPAGRRLYESRLSKQAVNVGKRSKDIQIIAERQFDSQLERGSF